MARAGTSPSPTTIVGRGRRRRGRAAAAGARRSWLRRHRRLILVSLSVLVVALGIRLFLLPASDPVVAADAVVVLPDSGQAGLQEGLGLVNRQVSPVLVVLGGAERVGGAERLCRGTGAVEVLCPVAPADGRGQARVLAALAAERGWTAIVLVADRPELSRDTLQVSRCTGVTVLRRAVSGSDAFGTVLAAFGAVPGYLRALAQQGC